MRNVKQ